MHDADEGGGDRAIESPELIASRVLADMSDGVITIDLRGKIIMFNPSAERILGLSAAEVATRSFGEVFFELESNDAFNQAILDAIYDASVTHNQVVSFHNGDRAVTLQLTTSFLQSPEATPRRIGVIAVFSDISEVRKLQETEMRMAEELKAKHRELQEAFRVTEASNLKLAEAVRKIQVTRRMAAGFTVLLLVLGGAYYLSRGHVGGGLATPGAVPRAGMGTAAGAMGTEWHTVAPQALSSSIALTGRLQPLQLINVNSPLMGKVERVEFQYGDMVKAGQVLLVMDVSDAQVRYRDAKAAYIKAADNLRQVTDWDNSMDVARAKRSLTKARLSLESQNKNLVETERLFKLGIIPANELESVRQQTVGQQLDYQSAEEELKAAQARGNQEGLQVARFEAENAKVRLQLVEAELAHAVVRAPVSGIVVKPAGGGPGGAGGKGAKTAERGEVFQSGEVLLAIGDLTAFSVVSKVDEVDVTKVRAGQKVYVTGDAFPGARLTGAIRSISPQAEEGGMRATPSFQVNMAIDALTPEQRQRILVGMSANVEIVVHEKADALLVPVSAVFTEGDKRFVARQSAGNGGSAEKVEVQTGATTLDAVEVVQGLQPGDVIERHGQLNGAAR